jgi:hypothetical protein
LLKGELLAGPSHVSLVGGLMYQMQRAGSGSVLLPGTGSNAVLRSWLFYDDVLIAGGVVAVVVALAFRQLRAPAVAGVLLVLMAMRPNGYLPAMYVIQALPFFAITLAGLADKGTAALLTWRAGTSRWETLLRRAALTVTAMAVAGYVLPQWYDGDRRAMTSAPNANYAAAADWIHGQIPDPQRVRIVVDDALWLDMVRDGFQPGLGAIWFYKVDLDPSVQRALPNGWRDVNYIVSSPTIRQDPSGLPAVRAALEHSRVLATFGTGADRIEIRQIIQGKP